MQGQHLAYRAERWYIVYMSQVFYGILIPFFGTALGAACVFFMKRQLSDMVQRILTGFAAGVMVAASIWSLLLPAIQNFPEGAIISMPLRAEGMKKSRAFDGGVLSGVVEPIGAALTIFGAELVVPVLPYLLSFAAGAMLYVVVEELIPEMSQGRHSNIGTISFAAGFSVMMMLDVTLG